MDWGPMVKSDTAGIATNSTGHCHPTVTAAIAEQAERLIHGQANGWEWATFFAQMVNWTDGCIALTNKDMDRVWDAIDPGTPIEILP